MSKVKITQIRSGIDRPEYQKRTLTALGLRKMHHSVIKDLNPAMSGMINAVKHLLKIENI